MTKGIFDNLERAIQNGGECGRLFAQKDWSKTVLGPVEKWSPILISHVCTVLESPLPLCVCWCPRYQDIVVIYNDASIPINGSRHPKAFGALSRETWPEVWEIFLDPLLKEMWATGKSVFLTDALFILERKGVPEEVFSNNAYSAMRDEEGRVMGCFVSIIDRTDRVQDNRRLRMLNAMAGFTANVSSDEEACTAMLKAMSENRSDIPFAQLYLFSEGGPRFMGGSGLAVDKALAWPLEGVRGGQSLDVAGPLEKLGSLPLMPGLLSPLQTPSSALILPVGLSGELEAQGALVVGINPLIIQKERYREFLALLARECGSVLGKVRTQSAMRERAEKLAEIDRAKTLFLSNVSHEFRTPITLILGPLEEMLAKTDASSDPKFVGTLEMARRNVLRLNRLVNDLLDFARIEAGRVQGLYERCDLSAVTRGIVSMFEPIARKTGLELLMKLPPLAGTYYVDRDMWEKIVLNLVSNAFKFTLKGRIEVSLDESEGRARLRVSDTGVGIPADVSDRVFDRFFRHRVAQARTHEGSGIGLSLVKDLAQLHGGRVQLESVEGRGSVFTVEIPEGSEHLPREGVRESRVTGADQTRVAAYVEESARWLDVEKGAARASAPRLIVVDDNPDMLRFITSLLADTYDVEAFSDGESALKAARGRPPDLVLSDIMMPGLDGFGLLKALREGEKTRAIPVILLSARAGEEATVEGLQTGADDYLVKPFSGRELLARVKTHLELVRTRKAETESQLKDRFLGIVFHELRTPLTHLDLRLQVARQEGASLAAGKGIFESMARSVERLSRLVADLENVSAIRFGKLQLSKEEGDLTALCIEAAQEVEATMRRKIRLKLGDRAVTGHFDSYRILQVLLNLLSNAVKYSAPSSPIEIELRSDGMRAEVSVADQGIGIPHEARDRLFEMFYQVPGIERSSGSQIGFGLGLYLCRDIVERHGGSIRVESAPGKGSRFSFVLPLRLDSAASPTDNESREALTK